jgi:Fur family transcriptional regulator, ferric uptake regulator
MTKNRQAMLDLLLSAREPLSAADAHDRLGPHADPVTVYRALHYLEDHGYADSFILHCESHGTKRYYTASTAAEGSNPAHHHWFHCERCHGFTDLGNCKMDALVREYERENGIEIKTHTLYMTGICARCKS